MRLRLLLLWNVRVALAALTWAITNPLPEGLRASDFALTARDLGYALNDTVEMVPFNDETVLDQALANNTVDLMLTGSGLSSCYQAAHNILPLATLALTTTIGVTSNQVAGIIFTHVNNTSINTVDDIKGRTIVTYKFAHLTSFQAQWGVLESHGVRMFVDTGTVGFTDDFTETVRAVHAKSYDVGFTYASHLVYLQSLNLFKVSDFKILNARYTQEYPYTVSTPLYPGLQLSANQRLDQNTSLAVASVFRLPKPDAAQAGKYTGVSAGFNVFFNLRLQAYLGIQVQPYTGCVTLDQWLSRLQCPKGFSRTKAPCDCPKYVCVCNQCVKNQPHIGKVTVATFVLALALPIVLVAATCAICCRAYHIRVQAIPSKEVQMVHQEATLTVGRFRDRPAVITDVPREPALGCHILGFRTRLVKLEYLVERRANLQHATMVNCIGLCRLSPHHSIQVFVGGESGTLQQMLMNPSVDLDTHIILKIMASLCDAFTYLHEHGHFGVDIRTHNILVARDCSLQCIADLTTPTPHDLWQAPEVLNGAVADYMSDAYVLAMLMYEILHRTEPFEGENPQDALVFIQDTTVLDRFRIEPEIARQHDLDILYDSMRDCWSSNPMQRPTIKDIKSTVLKLQSITQRKKSETGSYVETRATSSYTTREQALVLQDEDARASHVQYVAVLYAQGTDIGFLLDNCAKFEIVTVPCTTPGTFLGMALDLDAAKQIGQLAHLALGNGCDIQAAIHYGRVIKSLVPLTEPKFCMLGPAIPVTKYLQEAGKRKSVLVSSAAAEHLLGMMPPVGVLQKRPGVIKHRGYIDTQCYWLTV